VEAILRVAVVLNDHFPAACSFESAASSMQPLWLAEILLCKALSPHTCCYVCYRLYVCFEHRSAVSVLHIESCRFMLDQTAVKDGVPLRAQASPR